ncbi:LysM repeat protein [Micromonospora luteifusca]|uniref:LysM repeat protein n=1 Tax=Micromonospora luteifusca TaxID=709860 RepID=A0ABS2LUS9_9ACTN|nr:LysM peptidoglycan-binding domain-containing protein [Micromonospora luteifusca]MBM7491890.1 LysM repeat protein [Micromonospora luteifusca]
MPVSGGSVVRRTGRILTGIGALAVLCALLVGAPIALLAFAGNPLPDHLPTISEVGTALTSRDDGQLFLRALAVAGWFGWATFAFSVLVELGAQSLRRPAPKLPGMSRQQKAAAALVGSVALILAASPAAASAAAVYGVPAYASPSAPAVATLAAPNRVSTTPDTAAPLAHSGPLDLAGTEFAAPGGSPAANDEAAPVYRVARGDYLGEVAERYLDEFGDYRQLAELNQLDDPDRIRPGQLLRLPTEAADQGARRHATGRLVDRPAAPKPPPPRPAPERAAPERVDPAPPSGTEPAGQPPAMTVGAARAGTEDRVNRPLAVSAVLAVASIVGAQIGAVLGLRRRPATAGAAPRSAAPRLAVASGRPQGGTAWSTSGNTGQVGANTGRAGGTTSRGTDGTAPTGTGTAPSGSGTAPTGGGMTTPGSGGLAAPGGGMAFPGGGGMVPAGTSGWGDDDSWADDSAEGGLLDGGHGLDSVPDGPPVGRHRRS